MAFVLALWAALIAGRDLAVRRIANAALILVLAPALLALALNEQGLLGADRLSSLLGLGLALTLTLPGYALGQLGAGDAKFAAVLGLLLGVQAIAACLLAAALILGLMAAVSALARGERAARMPTAPALALAFAASLAGLLPAL